ncbi:MAG TPA: cytosolic protein [Clostridiales bacterium]|jgi:hypothetical protein|nr:cytosolic protein [Clostridiales bacterium]
MIDPKDIQQFVEDHIVEFHDSRIRRLSQLNLQDVLRRKNPYLFRAKNITTVDELIRQLLVAFSSSQEETIFGEFLEKLAIYSCQLAKGGFKSGIENIDLEFEEDGTRYIITIKSGPNWGNSSQIRKMVDDFNKAKIILRTQNRRQHIVAINGCCYGRDRKPDKGSYFKLCGQEFWQFITGESEYYATIIEPLGYRAKEKNDAYMASFSQLINRFSHEFYDLYCLPDGRIDREQLLRFNSGSN